MKIEINNEIMNVLVNYGFHQNKQNIIDMEQPIELCYNIKLLEIGMKNVPLISFISENSNNPIEFYVVKINPYEKLRLSDIRLKTNYYTFINDKYQFN